MKSILVVLLTLLPSSLALAQSSDPNQLVYDGDGNPDNWCRNGHFPALTQDYSLGEITRPSGMLGDERGCPSLEAGRCEPSKVLETGTFVAVSKPFGDFLCTFDPRDQSAGWIATKDIAIQPAAEPAEADWVGTWTDGYNGITIAPAPDGLKVTGAAEWVGATLESGEQVVHQGELDFVAKPTNNRLLLQAPEDYDCAAEFIHLGRFLVVRDNSYCGGANVRFNGVYAKK